MNFVLFTFSISTCSITKVIMLSVIDAILLRKTEKLEGILLQVIMTVSIISLTSKMKEGNQT